MKYRRKPITGTEFEAMQLQADNADEILNWALNGGAPDATSIVKKAYPGVLAVRTPAGEVLAGTDDWIAKLSDGTFSVVKAETFAAYYEKVDEMPVEPFVKEFAPAPTADEGAVVSDQQQ